MKKSVIHKMIFVLPIFYIFWGVFVYFLGGPVYLSRIDPEFPYLLNGLNCAIFEFDQIGHVDHPGTPFQIITGIFIWIIYLVSGHDSIVESVLSNPEMYFTWSAFLLTVISAAVLLWLGKIMIKHTNDIFGVIILQSSFFFSFPLIDVPYRYFPDRLLVTLMLIFIGLCLKLFYGNYKVQKFTIWSGIIMGLGFVTKFVFLPFLIIPFILVKGWKEKFRYILTLAISCVIFFLPVVSKFTYFKNFIIGLITHEGQYGSGNKQVLDTGKFTSNLGIMIWDNISFFVLIILSTGIVLVFSFKPIIRKKFINEYMFLIAIILATIISIVMVGKHYKDYYLNSLIITGGFVFYILWRIGTKLLRKNNIKYIFYFFFILILYLSTNTIYPGYKFRKYCYEDNRTNSITINNLVSDKDYLFIEPTWQSGPFLTNGLVYGLSYVYNRQNFFNGFEKIHPYLLTYEGNNKPMKYARMVDADNEAIIKSGKAIFIHSTPGRNANVLIQYLNSEASKYKTALVIDTVFKNHNNDEYLIRLQNEEWITINEIRTGFEKIIDEQIYCDNEKIALNGDFKIDNEKVCNGFNSIILDMGFSQSPKLVLENVNKGDYIELTIKRKINQQDDKGMLVIGYGDENQKPIYYSNGETVSSVNEEWEFLRLSTIIKTQPHYNYIQCYYQYTGSSEVYIDDFTIKHLGRK